MKCFKPETKSCLILKINKYLNNKIKEVTMNFIIVDIVFDKTETSVLTKTQITNKRKCLISES